MKRYTKDFVSIAFAVLALLIFSAYCFAYGNDRQANESLGGIKLIGIVIDWNGSGIEEEALEAFKDNIKNNVSEMLLQKGIKVQPEDTLETPPFFFLEIRSIKCGPTSHALYIIAKVMREVALKRKQSVKLTSPTWSSGGVVGIVGEETIQDIVSMLVHEFVTSYLSANPRDESNTGKVI